MAKQQRRNNSGRRNNHRSNNSNNSYTPRPKMEAVTSITYEEGISVGELAQKMNRNASDIIKLLFMLGKMVTINSSMDDETIELVCMEYGVEVKKEIPVDLVLIAAGFLGTEKYVADAFGVDLNGRTNVATAEGAYETSVKNVFAAGDVHRGQSLVVWAIREGREVAREVDESLMGYSYLEVQ